MYLGFDTSNYTTSVALFDGENIYQARQLLSVKNGERGLRQSDAVFQHIVNMPVLLNDVKNKIKDVRAVAVSTRPRNIDGSYMPCFLVGKNNAVCASSITGARLYETSHQVGHILAALYSVGKLDFINDQFIAFHVSGGTTEALLVEPDSKEIIKATVIAQSTDLKAGQAIDRAGVMMGYTFPCGKKLDELSQKSSKKFNIKPSMIGMDCSLSGIENKAKAMLDKGEGNEDISKFVLSSISCTIDKMTENLITKYDNIPIIYAGGVMSNTLIKTNIMSKYNNAYFAHPAYSCDNACGIAIYAYLKDKYE
ncbi:MAG: peptidase M22 [Eubacterium sp.]|nr:peptidase M22 [Eubacterium sp.]